MNSCDRPLHLLETSGLVAIIPLRQPRRFLLNGPRAVAGIGMVRQEYEGPALVVQPAKNLANWMGS